MLVLLLSTRRRHPPLHMVTSDPQVPKVGNVSTRTKEWEKIYKDPWILGMARGVTIPLREEGQGQERAPFPFRLSQLEEQALGVEMTKLIETGVVEETTLEQVQFIPNVFLRPKQNGGFRLILDLTEFNKGVDYQHFKMTSLQCVADGGRMALVAPQWPGQPWYARLMSLTKRKNYIRRNQATFSIREIHQRTNEQLPTGGMLLLAKKN